MAIIVSRRYRPSRGLLAWMVVRLPSWPVFMACSMSSASSPRTSPTTMRSGRIRSALMTSCRCLTAPLPSMFADLRLQPDDVALPQHQLGGVLNRHDALVVGDEAGEDVEQRRLTGAGAARHDDVEPRGDGATQEVQHRRGQRLARDEIVGSQAVGAEAPDRHRRAVERQRRNDDVDARPVLQACVHHRARFVNAPADRADDALDDLHQVLVVAKHDVGLFELAFTLDEHRFALLTRMSEMFGSLSSTSSGPRPNSSLSTSAMT